MRTDAEYFRLKDDAATGLDLSPGNATSRYAAETIDVLDKKILDLRDWALAARVFLSENVEDFGCARSKALVETLDELLPKRNLKNSLTPVGDSNSLILVSGSSADCSVK